MSKTLHILTKPDDALARNTISFQEKSGVQCETVDFNQGEPDYRVLVEKIFEAESVQVW